MDAIVTQDRAGAALDLPRAAVGLIIPSVNTMSEPQFNHFAPDGLGIHITRARVAGPWRRPLDQMAEEIAFVRQAAGRLRARPDRLPLHRHVDERRPAGRRAASSTSSATPPASRRSPPAAWCSRRCARSG